VPGQSGDHARSLQPQANLRWAGRVFRIFARLLLAAANGYRLASNRGWTAGAPALRGLQGHAERGGTPRLSLGSLNRSRCTRPPLAAHEGAAVNSQVAWSGCYIALG